MNTPKFPFEANADSDVPLWVQLRKRIIALISSGYFKPGDKLPTVRGLASEISINYNTVNKAYLSLVSDGYLESTRGRGVFVCQFDTEMGEEHADEVDALLSECIDACRELGLSLDEIRLSMVRKIQELKHVEDSTDESAVPVGAASAGNIIEINVGAVREPRMGTGA